MKYGVTFLASRSDRNAWFDPVVAVLRLAIQYLQKGSDLRIWVSQGAILHLETSGTEFFFPLLLYYSAL